MKTSYWIPVVIPGQIGVTAALQVSKQKAARHEVSSAFFKATDGLYVKVATRDRGSKPECAVSSLSQAAARILKTRCDRGQIRQFSHGRFVITMAQKSPF